MEQVTDAEVEENTGRPELAAAQRRIIRSVLGPSWSTTPCRHKAGMMSGFHGYGPCGP
jgi:hypothetical protein